MSIWPAESLLVYPYFALNPRPLMSFLSIHKHAMLNLCTIKISKKREARNKTKESEHSPRNGEINTTLLIPPPLLSALSSPLPFFEPVGKEASLLPVPYPPHPS
jgi:hypothetical protein